MLNQKLEMMKLSEEGMSEAEGGWKVGLLVQTVGRVVDPKERFLKEIKTATPVNTWMVKEWSSLIADMRKVSVVCKEDQTSHSVPLSQGLIQIKALTVFSSVKAERGEKAVEEKYETSRGWFMKFKQRNHFYNKKSKTNQEVLI